MSISATFSALNAAVAPYGTAAQIAFGIFGIIGDDNRHDEIMETLKKVENSLYTIRDEIINQLKYKIIDENYKIHSGKISSLNEQLIEYRVLKDYDLLSKILFSSGEIKSILKQYISDDSYPLQWRCLYSGVYENALAIRINAFSHLDNLDKRNFLIRQEISDAARYKAKMKSIFEIVGQNRVAKIHDNQTTYYEWVVDDGSDRYGLQGESAYVEFDGDLIFEINSHERAFRFESTDRREVEITRTKFVESARADSWQPHKLAFDKLEEFKV